MSLEELKGNPQAGKVSISHQQVAVARFAWAWGAAGAKFSSGGRGARYRRSDVKEQARRDTNRRQGGNEGGQQVGASVQRSM